MKELQSNQKRGFTLVELVVVLVILAVLAALLVPSLSGYIDKAKEKRVVAEVHQVVTAAQTLADEIYALQSTPNYNTITVVNVAKLAEIKGDIQKIAVNLETGKVKYVEVELSGITGYFDSDEEEILTSLSTPPSSIPQAPAADGDYCIIEPES